MRESEFPLPSVVLEAIYRPQSSGGAPTPLPDVRREFFALSKHEEALQQHVTTHANVPCYVNPPPPGQCTPGSLVVEVPEFDGTQAPVASVDDGPKGCAQIEATSSQDRILESRDESGAIAQRFLFTDNSAELSEDAGALAATVAAELRKSPELQCIGVVGQYVRGETLALAFARAQAVRELLVAQGVEPERLVALTLDQPMTGASGTHETSTVTDRRVSLSVLLKLSPSEGPGGESR